MQLIINTYGTYIHVKDDMFEVRKPKEKSYEKKFFAAHKVSSIIVSKGAALSTDAIIKAMKFNIDIVVLEYDGIPIGRFWHSRPGSTSKIRKMQLETSMNEKGVEYVVGWISAKLNNQVGFLKRLKKHRKTKAVEIQEKIDAIESLNEKLKKISNKDIGVVDGTIRGLEGAAGRHYFSLLSNLLSKNYKFDGRSFRPAKDPFNAFLNYAYGIMYSRVEKSLVIAGLDPFVGFMHRDDYNTKSLVFDFIEAYRIYAEVVVFRLFSAKKVNNSHTDEITNGVSLNAEGKNLLLEHFMTYFEEEKIKYKGKNQTRANALQMDAHRFANELINK